MTTGTTGSGLQINFTYAENPSTLPAGFVDALNYAAQQIESVITTPISVTLNVDYEVPFNSSVIAWSQPPFAGFDYGAVKAALANIDPSAAASMPATDPIAGSNNMLWLAAPQAAALGLTNNPAYTEGDFGQFDDIGFNSSMPFTFDPNNRAVAGAYDFIGLAEHEITEALGRADIFGTQSNTGWGNLYTLLDMFHYTAPGTNTYTGTQANYFSPDGGHTVDASFNTSSAGDLNDWANGSTDAFAAFGTTGIQLGFSPSDVALLNALGYTTTGMPPSPPPGYVNVTGNVPTAIEGGATNALGKVAVVDNGSTSLNAASITIADVNGNPMTGDELFVNGIQNGALGNGVTASWNASTSTLTLSGTASLQTYDTLLSEVSFQDTGTDTSTSGHPQRTISWSADDGTNHLSGTSQIEIDRAPVEMPAAASTSLAVGASVSAASLFNPATDADRDQIQTYVLGDSNPSVGQWYLNGQPVSGQINESQLSQVLYRALSAGTDNATLQANDGFTLSSAQNSSVAITVTTSGGTTGETLTANDTAGQQLVGTPYNDTFYAGHSSVVMTGNGGADTFIFPYVPWSAGSITDFNTADDALDLSALLSAAGYTGSNPVADGYLQFADDGRGDTQVYLNSHSASDPYPSLITTLDHVSPASITPADYGYGSNSGGNGTITISGTVADQATQDDHSISPFTGVSLADTNSGATETLTVTLSNAANGQLSNLGGGSYDATTGVYTDTGTVAQVAAALDNLVFAPTEHQVAAGDTVTTSFTISDTDSAGASATNSNTSVVTTATAAGTTGVTLTADDSAGQQLTGTPNDDIFYAGHNSVVMTGDGGADTFVFQYEPWNAGSITDFTPGNDKLDLSALLSAARYTGSDPVADGYVTFSSDGSGDTNVYFNPHDASQSWPSLITTLDGIAPTGLTAANTLGTAGSGGGTGETLTANDTAGQQLTGTPNDDIFYAGHNSVVMTGDGGADTFVFQYEPWNAGSITDFNTAADVLNLKGIFAAIGYTGSNPVADGYLAFQSDGQGDTQVIVNPQGPATQIPITVTTLDHVDPSAIHAGDYIFA
ncbi:MAG TPA: NF038122 family metalloprotease [Stellaceae bacterium]|jgi:plastocyanin|nr:NF038122 family metalloprotease [Stellaceae bacterium]